MNLIFRPLFAHLYFSITGWIHLPFNSFKYTRDSFLIRFPGTMQQNFAATIDDKKLTSPLNAVEIEKAMSRLSAETFISAVIPTFISLLRLFKI
jgi:hypothetical protein